MHINYNYVKQNCVLAMQ